jgi:uncharacterized tellurite resistance protein B-like protein
MLQSLTRLLDSLAGPDAAKQAVPDREHALRLATAALLFEIVRADGDVRDEERAVMRAAVQSSFGLPAGELEELLREAEHASLQATSLYEFTQRVDQELDAEQKKRVVELLWLIVFADDSKDALEEHLVRKIASLLHVRHPDFIDAKLKAKERQV